MGELTAEHFVLCGFEEVRELLMGCCATWFSCCGTGLKMTFAKVWDVGVCSGERPTQGRFTCDSSDYLTA
jgi:hypothetical protein